jgi:hypothetical protein
LSLERAFLQVDENQSFKKVSSDCFKMAQIVLKWFRLVLNGLNWFKTAQIGFKWLRLVSNVKDWFKWFRFKIENQFQCCLLFLITFLDHSSSLLL